MCSDLMFRVMHASEFLCIPLQWSSLGGMSNAFPLRRPAVVC